MFSLRLLAVTPLLAFATANTVQWEITQNVAAREAQLLRGRSALSKRADTVTAVLGNAEQAGIYFANITVGTPAQPLQVQIDTGSSDTWVPSATASQCSDQKAGGCSGGSFDPSSSSTFDIVGENEFNISYVDGTGSTGDYFQDTFSIGGETLDVFEMGLALDTTIGVGIMGIGYNASEANVNSGNGTIYANLPQALQNAGKTNANAYSLWLNDLQASTGSVLFGGIDTKKYTGNLTSVQIYPTLYEGGLTQFDTFTVAFTQLSATSSSGTDVLTPSGYAVAAILDSGTTITLLPDDVAEVVFEEFGAQMDQELGAVVVPCSLADKDGTLNYQFGGDGGPTIQVSVSQLVLPLTLPNGQVPQYTNGQDACQLGIQAAGNLPVLFGDTFLRSAYVVYDLDNNRIALAPTDFNSTDSNIVPFSSGGASIPSATPAPSEAAVTQTATANPKVGVTATATGDGADATYNPTATGFSAAAGFTATGTAKKGAAGSGPAPFAWSAVVILGTTIFSMGLGSGLVLCFL